jgi:hypothetical protein
MVVASLVGSKLRSTVWCSRSRFAIVCSVVGERCEFI